MSKRKADTVSVAQLCRMFPDENACYTWLEKAQMEWAAGMPPLQRHRRHIPAAQQASHLLAQGLPKAVHRHHEDLACTPPNGLLQDWIFAIYSVLTARKGVSAMQLSNELGCQSRTAWHMLHRIREACGRGDFNLTNVVEADETYTIDRPNDFAKGGGGKRLRYEDLVA